ncbi:MAG: hypothetical protein K8F56_17125, partial [Rhodocyclaceae bacterium]|nr:hypothetical protein [Rhodocyclaceae bacterium]
ANQQDAFHGPSVRVSVEADAGLARVKRTARPEPKRLPPIRRMFLVFIFDEGNGQPMRKF